MTEEICANCGHVEEEHDNRKIKRFGIEPTACRLCPCKKFTPKNHSPQLANGDTPSDNSHSLPFDDTEGTQNHSPQSLKNRIKGGLTGDNSKSLSDKIFDSEYFEGQISKLFVKDVKNFIKAEGVLLLMLRRNHLTWNMFLSERKKLAGADLI